MLLREVNLPSPRFFRSERKATERNQQKYWRGGPSLERSGQRSGRCRLDGECDSGSSAEMNKLPSFTRMVKTYECDVADVNRQCQLVSPTGSNSVAQDLNYNTRSGECHGRSKQVTHTGSFKLDLTLYRKSCL